MNRKYVRRGVAAAVAIMLVLSGAGCSNDEPKSANSAAVSPNGATISLNGVTVTVPQGSVKTDTELSVTAPARVEASRSPFGLGSTRIDISFKDDAQPASGKPLTVAIPLKGIFRPKGTNADMALLYHKLPDGGYRLLPALVKDNTLIAQLPHLSQWDVVYLNDQMLRSQFGYGQAEQVSRENCKAEVNTKAAGKVRFGKKQGWSTAKNSPVYACLYTSGDDAALRVINHMNYMLPVAATDGLKIDSPAKDAEEELVRLITRTIFPDARVKTFLGRGNELNARLPSKDLPITVQLTGDPSTFLAESVWFTLKFLAGIFLGKPGNEVAADIKVLIEAPQVVSCLQNTLKFSQGDVPSMGDVAELLTGKCAEAIADQLKVIAANQNVWKAFWGRVFTVAEGVIGGWNSFWTAADGIKLQFNNTISIQVVSESVETCPSQSDLQTIMENHFPGKRVNAHPSDACQDGWSYSRTALWWTDTNGWSDPMNTLVRWNGSRWVVVIAAGTGRYTDGDYDNICHRVPPRVRQELCY